MEVVQFHPEHLRGLQLHRETDRLLLAPVLSDWKYAEALVAAGPCFSGFVGDQVVACVGLIKQWEGRALAWALMTSPSGKHMTAITRAVKRFFETTDFWRIEAAVDTQFAIAVHWAELLGFKLEGVMRKYTPDGRDAFLYARVRG